MKTTIFNKKFIIKHQDMYGEKNFEIVKGNFFSENKDKKYIYQSKFGSYEVSLKDGEIRIIKDKNNFKIKFNGEKNKCLYRVENYEYYLFFLGKNYFYDKEKKIFSIMYEIYDENNEKLNEINFSIKEL